MSDEMTEKINDFELETKCEPCHGKGHWSEEGSGRRQVCARCDGSGYSRTAFGEKVLNLLRHNLSELLRSLDDQ